MIDRPIRGEQRPKCPKCDSSLPVKRLPQRMRLYFCIMCNFTFRENYDRICKQCKSGFKTPTFKKQFCTESCRLLYYDIHPKYKSPQREMFCAWCKDLVITSNIDKKYCCEFCSHTYKQTKKRIWSTYPFMKDKQAEKFAELEELGCKTVID